MTPKTTFLLLAAVFCAALAGCPSTSTSPTPSYPEKTTLPLGAPRCSGQRCTCRPLDSNENQTEQNIPPGLKRFEFRLPKTTSAIWVEVVGKGTFFKPKERVDPVCFYVDLPRGKTRFVVHSELSDPEIGLQTGLKVLEYGPKDGPHWYRVFEMSCGGLNKCTKAGMRAWVEFQRKLPRAILNPCGSTRIREVSATGTREQKIDVEYKDLTVRFALEVYEFETYKAPDSPECQGPAKDS